MQVPQDIFVDVCGKAMRSREKPGETSHLCYVQGLITDCNDTKVAIRGEMLVKL